MSDRAHHLRCVTWRVIVLLVRVIHVVLLSRVSTSAASSDVIVFRVILVVRTARCLRAASHRRHVLITWVRVSCACVHDVIGVVVNRGLVVVERGRVCGGHESFRCVHVAFVWITWVIRELRATSGAR